MAPELRQDLFEVGNSLKAYEGEFDGLRDTLLLGAKVRWEAEFRQRLEKDTAGVQRFGDVWFKLEELQRRKLRISPRLNVANPELLASPHLQYASELVRYIRAVAEPESEREARYKGADGRQLREALRAPTNVDPVIARFVLAGHLEVAHNWLPPEDPLYKLLFDEGESLGDAIHRISEQSMVLDSDYRSWLMAAGVEALEESVDPLIVFSRYAVRVLPGLWRDWEEILAAEAIEQRRLAQALFRVYGPDQPPDATFTLRISDGHVKGYEYNGTWAPPVTSFFGMYAKSTEFGSTGNWALPPAFRRAQSRINMAVPINFVATTDITGGSSGGPVIDREGRIVGVAFDSNLEQLPNEFLFRKAAGRTIAVHSAGLLEALRSVYRANALFNELTGVRAGSRDNDEPDQ